MEIQSKVDESGTGEQVVKLEPVKRKDKVAAARFDFSLFRVVWVKGRPLVVYPWNPKPRGFRKGKILTSATVELMKAQSIDVKILSQQTEK